MSIADKKQTVVVTREHLRQFEPISSLSDERLDELVSLADVEPINMGVNLFNEGDVDNQTIYILKGDVQLRSSKNDTETTIRSNSEEGRFPIDDSQPRLYSAIAMSSVEIIRIDNSVLEYMMMWDQLAVAEITNSKAVESSDNIDPDVQKLVERAVLDSIENAKEQERDSRDNIDKNIDFSKTMKPELEKVSSESKQTVEIKNDENDLDLKINLSQQEKSNDINSNVKNSETEKSEIAGYAIVKTEATKFEAAKLAATKLELDKVDVVHTETTNAKTTESEVINSKAINPKTITSTDSKTEIKNNEPISSNSELSDNTSSAVTESVPEKTNDTKTESKKPQPKKTDVTDLKETKLEAVNKHDGNDSVSKPETNKTNLVELKQSKQTKPKSDNLDEPESEPVKSKTKVTKVENNKILTVSAKSKTTTTKNIKTDSVETKESKSESVKPTISKDVDKHRTTNTDSVNSTAVTKAVQNSKKDSKQNPIVYESRDWIRKIRQIMAFKNMPPANIKNLLEKMESVNVKKGDRIIEQGDAGDYYYIVTDGTAVVTRTIELATLSAGTSFGEEALVAKSPRNASVSMTSDGILMRLSKQDFDELLIEPLMSRVSPDNARSKILQGAKWLDVRHAKEFHHSRLPGAINIPLHELRLRMAELDKETEYICCCRTGARSASGSFLLAQNGFKVSLLSGGIQVMSQDLRR